VRTTAWTVAALVVLTACMPASEETTDEPTRSDGPVVLSSQDVTDAQAGAGCSSFEAEGGTVTARHVGEDGPPPEELYERRPPTDGDHLGRWVDAGVHDEAPDERAVVHNHEHGAVSVWYAPDAVDDADLDALTAWAEARNGVLANQAGAGVVVAPFQDGLAGSAVIAFRSWTGGLDGERFDDVVADGFLLERFGEAPEGNLAPDLTGVVDAATSA
jgi:hypothetical protein